MAPPLPIGAAVLIAVSTAWAGVLDPSEFASLGTVISADAVSVDTTAEQLTVGLTTYNGVAAPDGSIVFAFDDVDLSGTITVSGNQPFQILSHGNLRISSSVDLSASGRTNVVSGGQNGGASNGNTGNGSPNTLAGKGGLNAGMFGGNGGGGGGGGFGGGGGDGAGGGGAPGLTFGVSAFVDGAILPRSGSGGAGGQGRILTGGNANGGAGGGSGGIAGFGAIGSVELVGTFSAHGADGGNGGSVSDFGSAFGGGAGGGAGGGFLVYGATVDVDQANFQARGGNGGDNQQDGGAGGGGIVYVESNANSVTVMAVDVAHGAFGAGNPGDGVFQYTEASPWNIDALELTSVSPGPNRVYAPWDISIGGILVNDNQTIIPYFNVDGGTYLSPDVVHVGNLPNGLSGHGAVHGRIGGSANPISIRAMGGDLTLGDSTSNDGIHLNSSSTLVVDGVLATFLDADGAFVDGTITLEAGSRISSANGTSLTGTLSANGTATIGDMFVNDGTVNGATEADQLTFTGPVSGSGAFTGNVAFAGGLAIGSSPAAVEFEVATLLPLNTTLIELGGTNAGSEFDQLIVSGSITLGGSLEISYINSFMPQVGDQFLILDAASISGNFAQISLPPLDDLSAGWKTENLSSNGLIEVVAIPEPVAMPLLALSSGLLLLRRKR